jgi:hypothetical protein
MRYYSDFASERGLATARICCHSDNMNIKDGALVAIAAASLFASACKKEESVTGAASAKEKTAAMVHCGGINECKGKSLCATDKTSCAGQNACKGQGWIDVAAADCTAQGGKVVKGM